MINRSFRAPRFGIWIMGILVSLAVSGCGGGSSSSTRFIKAIYTRANGSALPTTPAPGLYLVTIAAQDVPNAAATEPLAYDADSRITGPASITLQGAYYRFYIDLGFDLTVGKRVIYLGSQHIPIQALFFPQDTAPALGGGGPTGGSGGGGCGIPIFYTLYDAGGNQVAQQSSSYQLLGGQTYRVFVTAADDVSAITTTPPLTFSPIVAENGGFAFSVTVPAVTSPTQTPFTITTTGCDAGSAGVSVVVNPG